MKTTLTRVASDILMEADNGGVSILVHLDLSTAFDHSILLHRLKVSYNNFGSAVPWFESNLHQRTQAVCYNGETTPPGSVAHGVLQSSVLGPLLFLLYTSDIPLITHIHGFPCQCYADHTQLDFHFKPGETAQIGRLECWINDIHDWHTRNRLRLNIHKAELMYCYLDIHIRTFLWPSSVECRHQGNWPWLRPKTIAALRLIDVWPD